jgi:hypothetical protein
MGGKIVLTSRQISHFPGILLVLRPVAGNGKIYQPNPEKPQKLMHLLEAN